jgi:hypothetical protein
MADELRFDVATPPTTDPASLAISPDGRNLVFVADDQGRSKLWLHALNELSSRPLPGTDGGFYPFWSSDGRSIGFFSGGRLRTIRGLGLSVRSPTRPIRWAGAGARRDDSFCAELSGTDLPRRGHGRRRRPGDAD